METLIKEINELLERKNTEIAVLKWEKEKLEKENAELKAKNEALENDVKMYQENRNAHKIGFNQGE